MALSGATVQAIEAALGNYSLTAQDLDDPDVTAEEIMVMFNSLTGTPGWEDGMIFDADDLAEYIRQHAEEAN